MESPIDILEKPYSQLPLSKSFKRFMNMNGFTTLNQLLEMSAPKLLDMKGFNMHSLKELYQLLEDVGLENRLKTT